MNPKRTYINNLDIAKVTDNQKFWKSVVPLFQKKIQINDSELIQDFSGFF